MSKFQIQTPLKHARGFGSGKSGTGHFWQQRVTGVAALGLSLVLCRAAHQAAGR